MYVVKRPFKNLGKTYTAGSVITEPAVIKRFKGKVAEGKIIEVTEQTYNSASAYFKNKYGVVLPPLSKEPIEENTKAETPKAETPKAETPKAETPKAETPKAETPKAETPIKAVVK